jgi:hypothetical protein
VTGDRDSSCAVSLRQARSYLRAGRPAQDFLLAGRDQVAARKLASSLGGHAEALRTLDGVGA